MLRKLLKYDMKSVWRLWWIVAVTLPFLAVVGGLAYRILYSTPANNVAAIIFSLMAGFAEMACMMGFAAASIATSILVFFRFYKNLFSDEGYLTFTLPASRRTIFLSKTLNALIWFSAYELLAFICVLIVFLIAPAPEAGQIVDPIVFEALGELFAGLVETGVEGWTVLYVVEFLIIIAVMQFFSICLVHLCITIGSVIAKKHKILAAIGIYYGISVVMSFLAQTLGIIFILGMANGLDFYLSVNDVSYPVLGLIFLMLALMISALGAICYSLTQWLIDRKLNLA